MIHADLMHVLSDITWRRSGLLRHMAVRLFSVVGFTLSVSRLTLSCHPHPPPPCCSQCPDPPVITDKFLANIPSSLLAEHRPVNSTTSLAWSNVLKDPVFTTFFVDMDTSSGESEVMTPNMDRMMMSGRAQCTTDQEEAAKSRRLHRHARRRKPQPRPRPISAAMEATQRQPEGIRHVSSGAPSSSSSGAPSSSPHRATSLLDHVQTSVSFYPSPRTGGGRHHALITDEIRGLMLRALEHTHEDDSYDSSEGFKQHGDTLSEDEEEDDDDDNEMCEDDNSWMESIGGTRAFIGKSGLVFGFWSKTPYG